MSHSCVTLHVLMCMSTATLAQAVRCLSSLFPADAGTTAAATAMAGWDYSKLPPRAKAPPPVALWYSRQVKAALRSEHEVVCAGHERKQHAHDLSMTWLPCESRLPPSQLAVPSRPQSDLLAWPKELQQEQQPGVPHCKARPPAHVLAWPKEVQQEQPHAQHHEQHHEQQQDQQQNTCPRTSSSSSSNKIPSGFQQQGQPRSKAA